MPERMTYLLRTSDKDRRAYGGFQYPESGPVAAPDWNPAPQCGGGLHGLLMGVGDGSLLDWSASAVWQVLAVDAAEIVAIDAAKVKVPRAEVVYSGNRDGALAYLVAQGADPSAMVAGQATASGYYGQATASGYYGQATASGYRGQATASGHRGQATASGYYGQATASGDYGQATASGDRGRALGRYRARAGELGVLICCWWDAAADRERVAVGYVGENGIKPHTWYEANTRGELVEVVSE